MSSGMLNSAVIHSRMTWRFAKMFGDCKW